MRSPRVLLIAHADKVVHALVKQLKRLMVDYLWVQPHQLIAGVGVEHSWYGDQQVWRWYIDGMCWDMRDLQGIYCPSVWHLDMSIVESAAKCDRSYVLSAWEAYIYFALNQHHNVLNPQSHEQWIGLTHTVPFVWQSLQEQGIAVARYYMHSQSQCMRDWCQHQVAVMPCVDLHMPRRLVGNGDGTIDQGLYLADEGGSFLVIHIADKQCWASCIYLGDKTAQEADMPEGMRKPLLKVCQKLQLRVAQFVFKCRGDAFAVYHVSAAPDWSLCAWPYEDIAQQLYQSLLPASCYIPTELRPEVGNYAVTCTAV